MVAIDVPVKVERSESNEKMMMQARQNLKSLERSLKILSDKNHLSSLRQKQIHVNTNLADQEKIKNAILAELRAATCPTIIKKDKEQHEQLEALLDKFQTMLSQIDDINTFIKQIKQDQNDIMAKSNHFEKAVQREMPAKIPIPRMIHRISILENELYKISSDNNLILKKNLKYKYQIHELLKIRFVLFMHILSIRQKTAQLRKEGAQITDEANEKIDECFEGLKQTVFLRNQNDKQNGEYRIALWECEMKMMYDAGLYTFYGMKINPRSILEHAEEHEERRKNQEMEMYFFRLDNAKYGLSQMQRFLSKGQDPLNIIGLYEKQEQHNFSIFRAITDINERTENVEMKILALVEEISEDQRDKNELEQETKANAERVAATMDYQKEVLEDKITAEELNEESIRVLDKSIRSIIELTSVLGTNPLLEALGQTQGRVNFSTMELMFKILEHKIGELMYQKYCLHLQRAVEIHGQYLPNVSAQPDRERDAKPKSSGGPFIPKITATSRLHQVEVDDVNQHTSLRPGTFKEVREMLMEEFHNEKLEAERNQGGKV